MRLSVDRKQLSSALALVASVVPVKSMRPVLQCIKLTAIREQGEMKVTLAGTDLEVGIATDVDAVVDIPGEILLPSQKLVGVISKMSCNDVGITAEKNIAAIRADNGCVHLNGMDAQDYPIFDADISEPHVSFRGNDIAEAAAKSLPFVARGLSNYSLNGVFVNFIESKVEFASSDTKRLGRVIKRHEGEQYEADGIVLPKGVAILARVAADAPSIDLSMQKNELVAKTENTTLRIRRIEGVFPDIRPFFAEDKKYAVCVNKSEFIRNIAIAASLHEKDIVLIDISENQITLSSKGDIGDSSVSMPADTKGRPEKIKFDGQFLLEGIKQIDAADLEIQYGDAKSMVRIDSGDFTYLLMPIAPDK